MEDEFVVREKKILSIIQQEIDDGEAMAAAVRHIAERMLLNEKGFAPQEIRKNISFDVMLGEEITGSSVDFLVTLDGRDAMIIKCAAGSLSSRERHAVAIARVYGSMPVPLAVVMDPMSAVVLDSMTGKTVGEGFEAIPTREQLIILLAERNLQPVPADKLEREKRILLAFDAIQCCIPRGKDGGVQLEQSDQA